jgi:tetratricopeptide (TPR) repeat protein
MTMGRKLTLLMGLAASAALGGDLERAQKLYDRTEYPAALEVLSKSSEPRSGAAWELAGKANYQLGEFKRAIESFEKATQAEPDHSRYHNWLGRAWGRRAETSNPLAAPGYASKARRSFERAVQLNPKDQDAVNDLLSYYLEAPGFLGGGLDKATALAEKVKTNDLAGYHSALAQIAERQKQYDLAEGQLRRAVALAPKQVGRVVDLAKFLARRGKYNDSDRAFQQAARVDPDSRLVLYARAETYVETKRNLDTARELLQQYLRSPLTADDPSREEARRLLQRASGE